MVMSECMRKGQTLFPEHGRVGVAKGRCPSIHGLRAKVDLEAPGGTGDLR